MLNFVTVKRWSDGRGDYRALTVVWKDNKIIGELEAIFKDGGVASILSLKIPKGLRKQGYGRLIVESLRFKGLTCTGIKKSAVGFWQKMGFTIDNKKRVGVYAD